MATAPTTQCPFCGAPLTLEGDYCPNCGSKKQQFTEHRANMKAYKKAFEDTRNTVVAENRRDSKKAASIAVIAVLIALILAEFIVTRNAFRIMAKHQANVAKRNAVAVLAAMDRYEENEQYKYISEMWYENNLRYLNEEKGFREYHAVSAMADAYGNVVSEISGFMKLVADPESDYEGFETGVERRAGYVADYYHSFLKKYESYVTNFKPDDKYYTYHPDGFSEEHMETYGKLKENLRCMISYYYGIPIEEMDDFDNLSQAKKSIRLIDAAEEKYVINTTE